MTNVQPNNGLGRTRVLGIRLEQVTNKKGARGVRVVFTLPGGHWLDLQFFNQEILDNVIDQLLLAREQLEDGGQTTKITL